VLRHLLGGGGKEAGRWGGWSPSRSKKKRGKYFYLNVSGEVYRKKGWEKEGRDLPEQTEKKKEKKQKSSGKRDFLLREFLKKNGGNNKLGGAKKGKELNFLGKSFL